MSVSTRRRPTRRAGRRAMLGSLLVGMGLSALLIWQTSYAAYSYDTANPTDQWATGNVVLVDDDNNTALFNATGLRPGSTGTRCIAVTYTGNLPAVVNLWGTGPLTTNGLSSVINLVVTQGTGGGFGSCSGFTPLSTGSSVYSGTLAAFPTGGYATGLSNWATSGTATESRTYQFTWTIDPNAGNTTQNGTASIGLTWQAQS